MPEAVDHLCRRQAALLGTEGGKADKAGVTAKQRTHSRTPAQPLSGPPLTACQRLSQLQKAFLLSNIRQICWCRIRDRR